MERVLADRVFESMSEAGMDPNKLLARVRAQQKREADQKRVEVERRRAGEEERRRADPAAYAEEQKRLRLERDRQREEDEARRRFQAETEAEIAKYSTEQVAEFRRNYLSYEGGVIPNLPGQPSASGRIAPATAADVTNMQVRLFRFMREKLGNTYLNLWSDHAILDRLNEYNISLYVVERMFRLAWDNPKYYAEFVAKREALTQEFDARGWPDPRISNPLWNFFIYSVSMRVAVVGFLCTQVPEVLRKKGFKFMIKVYTVNYDETKPWRPKLGDYRMIVESLRHTGAPSALLVVP